MADEDDTGADRQEKLVQEVAKLKTEVDRWKKEAQDAKSLAATSASTSDSAVDLKAKELARKNRELSVQLQKAQDDLAKAGAGGGGAAAGGASDLRTSGGFTSMKVKAKVDADAQAEIDKLRKLYNEGVTKVGKLESKVGILQNEKLNLEAALTKEIGSTLDVRAIAEGKAHKRRDVHGENIVLKSQLAELKLKVDKEEPKGDAIGETRGGFIWKQRYAEAADDLAAVKEEMRRVRIVADGAVSRRTCCEIDLAKAREQIKVLIAKSADDDRLVAALKAELDNVRAGGKGSSLADEVEVMRRKNAQLSEQIDRQAQMVESLQAQLLGSGGDGGQGERRRSKAVEATGREKGASDAKITGRPDDADDAAADGSVDGEEQE